MRYVALAVLLLAACREAPVAVVAAPRVAVSVPWDFCGEHAIIYDLEELEAMNQADLRETLREVERTRATIVSLLQ